MNGKLARRMPTLFTREETAALLTPEERNLAGDCTPTLTAANACLTQDGAAFLVLASGRQLAAPVQPSGLPDRGRKDSGRNRAPGGSH